MKKLLFLLIPGFALAQSPDQNYIKTTIYKDTTQNSKNIQLTYFDGLGRPIQKVDNAQSNTGKDIVTHIEYDAFGRQVKDFLPFPTSQNTMQYIDGTTGYTTSDTYYQDTYNDSTPFSEKQLEASPLNRVLKQAAPGNSWAMNSGHEIKFDYQTNTSSEAKLYQVTTTWNASKQLYDISISNPVNYQANQLYKTVTKNENWTFGNDNTTQEFKDKEGRVVLKRTFNNTVAHDTYYVYDIYGNLTYVIPPLADGAYDDTTLNGLCYQYKYDYRNRLAAKKLPGKQWEFIVYDKLDRPVATGPAFSPSGDGTSGILITEYDVFGRVTQTGWKAMSITESTRGSWQTNITSGSNPFALGINDILTKNFYDNYSFPNAPLVVSPYVTNVKGLQTGSWVKVLDPTNPNASELSYTLYDYKYRPIFSNTTNHLGGYTKVETQLDWAGKTLSTTTRHKRLNGDTELVVKDIFEYTLQDRLSLHKQQINSLPEQLIAKNTYDEIGQLTSKNVGGTNVTGTSGLQKVDYTYNIRGWMLGINNIYNLLQGTDPVDLFAFHLSYNDYTINGSFANGNATLLYNGNISQSFWRTNSDNILRQYDYDYDNLNRLTNSIYSKTGISLLDSYGETLNYDKNGNILSLARNGDIDSDGTSPVNQIDNLQYTYHPEKKNQLMKVLDMSNSPKGFADDSDGINDPDDDYEYDDNGNLTKDDNKNITKITYNHLNLPTQIEFASTSKIKYIYTATGQKVKKEIIDPVSNGAAIIDYLSGFQYKNSMLQFFPHAEGYVKKEASGTFGYVFNYVDHLGNVRLSYQDLDNNGILGEETFIECTNNPRSGFQTCIETTVSSILEENHYYPFGLKHGGYNTNNRQTNYKYKYNGKELQDELGLNMYDYGWRNYMPDIGRWTQIDPLFNDLKFAHDNLDVDPDDEDEVYLAIINDAEVGGGIYNTDNLNPYGYGYNNPVSFDDPDGRCPSCDNDPDPIGGLLSWTDVDDVAVAVTTVTRGVFGMYDGKPKHIDGTDASTSDAGYLIAGAILPVVSGGTLKKMVKGADKLIDEGKKIHGNSKLSKKAQHIYEIFIEKTKEVVKTGISGGKVSKTDKSYRATNQVNKLNKAAGAKKYDSRIVKKIPEGKKARTKVLNGEVINANKNRKTLDPNIHKRP